MIFDKDEHLYIWNFVIETYLCKASQCQRRWIQFGNSKTRLDWVKILLGVDNLNPFVIYFFLYRLSEKSNEQLIKELLKVELRFDNNVLCGASSGTLNMKEA